MSKVFPYPIVICTFNRPEYFNKLISSIEHQKLPINPSQLHFYLDGYINSSDEMIGKPNQQSEIIEIINKNFTDSHLHYQSFNMGIARVHHDARNIAFSENAEWALILEDDVVLSVDALRFLQEIVMQESKFPTNTAVINLDCWKRINHKFRRGNFVASHGTRAYLISRKFHDQISQISKIYLDYFKSVEYRDKNYERMVAHMLPTNLLLPGSHSDEFFSSLVDHFKCFQFASSHALAQHIGDFGENANGILSAESWLFSPESNLSSSDFIIHRSDVTRIKLAHFLSRNFGLSLSILPLWKVIKIQGLYKTFSSVLAKILARVFRLMPI